MKESCIRIFPVDDGYFNELAEYDIGRRVHMDSKMHWKTMVLGVLLASCGSSESQAVKDLEGSWTNACASKGQTTLSYTGADLTGVYTTYAEDTCTTATTATTWTAAIDGGDAKSGGFRTLDISYTGFHAKALNQAGMDYLNSNAFCGSTDWSSNLEKDILDKECFGFTLPTGGRSLDIYKIDGNTVAFGMGAKTATDLLARPVAATKLVLGTRVA
jgi:hypothetical protein